MIKTTALLFMINITGVSMGMSLSHEAACAIEEAIQKKLLIKISDAIASVIPKNMAKEINRVNDQYDGGWTPLYWAVEGGNIQVVQLLLDNGAQVLARDRYDNIALDLAVALNNVKKQPIEIVMLLLTHASASYYTLNDLAPILIWAVRKGHIDVVKVLLARGVPVDVRDKRGWTPLHIAVTCQHEDIVVLLVANGAQPNECDEEGYTLLHRAVLQYFVNKVIVAALLAGGARVDVPDEAGVTPLDLARGLGDPEIISLLESHQKGA